MITIALPWPDKALSPNALATLRETFSYDPQTGALIRIKKTGQNVVVGSEAGWIDNQGYRRVRFDGRSLGAHRIAWMHFYGTGAPELIDHINGNRLDNRISNLREATRSINTQNIKKARADNRAGALGVREKRGRFDARIMLDGVSYWIGSFATKEEAAEAYLSKKREIHQGCTI